VAAIGIHDILGGRCYLGRHEYRVDTQRRIALPKNWRPQSPSENGYFLLKGRAKSLQLVPARVFLPFLQKLLSVSFANREASLALASFGEATEEVSCDKQGRITLTPDMQEHSGIESQALLVGAVTTIQIWNPESWEANRMDNDAYMDVLAGFHQQPDEAGVLDVLKQLRQS
jgi:MraZ protein